MTDTELLEQRLDLFQRDGWRSLVEEYTELAESLEKIYNIYDDKIVDLYYGIQTNNIIELSICW